MLRRGIITIDDNGIVTAIENTCGDLKEKEAVEFYNGIIVPGFVNCHCHLELSHMKGSAVRGEGLAQFVRMIRMRREACHDAVIKAISDADNEMYREGTQLCADICNTTETFILKTGSRIRYINLLEVFGIDPEKAEKRMDDIHLVAEKARSLNLPYWIVPHAAYSISLPLFRLLKETTTGNRITSVHFMETDDEKTFLSEHKGPILESYQSSGLALSGIETVKDHSQVVLEEITPAGNLILVHNTFADRDTIRKIKVRTNLYWCVCPNSNIYIENAFPPVDLLVEEKCEIVIGTDSLASNQSLSILEEMKALHEHFPSIAFEELIRWGTINGAKALGEEGSFGKIETGKNQGLLLIQDADLINLKLIPETTITRLV